jgi:ribosome maturation factor RimP
MIELEAISRFEGKEVQIKLNDGFNLTGTILVVYQESILFKTNQAESIISLSEITKVVERR